VKRLAAGRARALGLPTRGTTNPNRLRRMDNWITATQAARLRAADDPLVVDLGYGSSAVTTVELAERLRRVQADVRVAGVEIDPERVTAAAGAADPPRLDFVHGGFELAGLRPTLVRAANVLRQYGEDAAAQAWETMRSRLAPGGAIVEGTSDELGRRAWWVLVEADGPTSLVVACKPATLRTPGDLADRLPKALIHRNVPGESIYRFLADLDLAWATAAPFAAFGARQRWTAAARTMAADWPVDTSRVRQGELAVCWAAVAPR
jgi:SAM-dependent methyltransferase